MFKFFGNLVGKKQLPAYCIYEYALEVIERTGFSFDDARVKLGSDDNGWYCEVIVEDETLGKNYLTKIYKNDLESMSPRYDLGIFLPMNLIVLATAKTLDLVYFYRLFKSNSKGKLQLSELPGEIDLDKLSHDKVSDMIEGISSAFNFSKHIADFPTDSSYLDKLKFLANKRNYQALEDKVPALSISVVDRLNFYEFDYNYDSFEYLDDFDENVEVQPKDLYSKSTKTSNANAEKTNNLQDNEPIVKAEDSKTEQRQIDNERTLLKSLEQDSCGLDKEKNLELNYFYEKFKSEVDIDLDKDYQDIEQKLLYDPSLRINMFNDFVNDKNKENPNPIVLLAEFYKRHNYHIYRKLVQHDKRESAKSFDNNSRYKELYIVQSMLSLPVASMKPEDFPSDDELREQLSAIISEDIVEMIINKIWSYKVNLVNFRALNLFLYGGPGKGKTFFAQAFAEAIKVSFYKIDFPSIESPFYISGSSKTFSSSDVGFVTKALMHPYNSKNVKTTVILFDEADKVHGFGRSAIYGALATILDPDARYIDQFLEIPVDISESFKVLTANDQKAVPDYIQDRCIKIDFDKVKMDIGFIASSLFVKILSDTFNLDKDKLKEIGFTIDFLKPIVLNIVKGKVGSLRTVNKIVDHIINMFMSNYRESHKNASSLDKIKLLEEFYTWLPKNKFDNLYDLYATDFTDKRFRVSLI